MEAMKGDVLEEAGAGGDAPAVAPATEVVAEKVYVCLDVSGSIRFHSKIYPKWVTEDITKIKAPTDWVLWGSSAERRDNLEQVQEYLADDELSLGGTEPHAFIDLLPKSGVIDLHVFTDGDIYEEELEDARRNLAQEHADLRVRQVVITYVNQNLAKMNVGLSAIFDGYVLEMHRTRVYEGKKLYEFDAAPLDGKTPAQKILDDHLALGKTEAEMTKGLHYLAQRFANADPKTRQELRRMVRELATAVNREHRTKVLSAEEEQQLLDAIKAGDWMAVRAPFIGHSVRSDVKLLQSYCQKFLNETNRGALIRISAYAPMLLKTKDKGGDFNELEEVLLDHIMYLGLSEEAIIVLPATDESYPQHYTFDAGVINHITSALEFRCKINYDNTFGLNTLLMMREQAKEGVGSDGDARVGSNVLDHLAEQALGRISCDSHTLSSSAQSFGVNPFNRQPMKCVFLVPVNCDALPAERLSELDAWNAHMLSRFVRHGCTMPSVPLSMSLVLERCFAAWGEVRGEDAAKATKLKDVCRRYLARYPSPLTFTVGLPVVVEGTFATAAKLACAVLSAAQDPNLPVDVLTQFWAFMVERGAEPVWNALRPYAGVAADAPFPAAKLTTIRALATGFQYRKSARDTALRKKKGFQYSVRMYRAWLRHLVARGCDPGRLRFEELAARKDLLGVPDTEPLLCMHGCRPEDCSTEDDEVETICTTTGKPTLLNKATMEMWYVNQPQETVDRVSESLHKAMWQLVRKKNKKKELRIAVFPPSQEKFLDFVNHRVWDLNMCRDSTEARLLPTVPCARMVREVSLVHQSYQQLLKVSPKKFSQMLRLPREVCAFGECCEYIRKAVSEQQLSWIDSHATLGQLAGLQQDLRQDILSGKVSYRSVG